jgi:hypothetical protein
MTQRLGKLLILGLLFCFAGPAALNAQTAAGANRVEVEQYVGQLFRRIDASLSRYRASLDRAVASNRLTGTNTERELNTLFQAFDEAVGRAQQLFADKQLASTDIYDLTDLAAQLDNFMRVAKLGRQPDLDWAALRDDVGELARNYGVKPEWGQSNAPAPRPAPAPNRPADDDEFAANGLLTGTYRLDAARSDDAKFVATRAARAVPARERQRLSENLLARLEQPAELALEQRGASVIIAADNAPQITFEADGQYRNERAPNGGTIRTRATLNSDTLEIRAASDQNNGSTVVFEAIDGGRSLRVTRQIIDPRVPQPVQVVSVYEKVSQTARLDQYGSVKSGGYDDQAGQANDDFLLGDGVAVVGVLEQDLSTKTGRDNDRFTMKIRSPQQYEGAVIEGYITGLQRSGRATGRSRMVLRFERIRLLDGTTYRFAGAVEAVTSSIGEKVKIDDEGGLYENENRTATTAKRTGGGAAAGAIIGGILGGGKGAAIGTVIGAGGGAGTVIAEGRDDLEVLRGSEITVRASAPRNARTR